MMSIHFYCTVWVFCSFPYIYSTIYLSDGYVRVTGISVVGNYYQDTSVTFTCSADIIGQVGNVGVIWKLKNAVINPTTASRWRTETLPDDPQYPGRRQYQLKVNPMHTGDTGSKLVFQKCS